MKILHMMTNKNADFNAYYMFGDESVVKHNCDDKPAFDYLMKLDIFPAQHSYPDCKLVLAFEYFKHRFEELKANSVSLDTLRTSVYASVKFVAIELSVEDDEQQIFDTINSLGVDLTTDELLKNYLYKLSDEEEYKKWRSMFDVDDSKKFWGTFAPKSREQATRDKRVIDRFLHAFVLVKMWEFNLSERQKKEFVKAGNVYKACKSFVEDFGVNRIVLANEIIEYAKLYKSNFDDNVLEQRIPSCFGIKRIACFINATENVTLLPYVLYVLKNVTDMAEINKICGVLETYILRRKLTHSDDKMYTDLFSENLIGGQKCLSEIGLIQYLNGRHSALSVPDDFAVKSKIQISGFDEESVRLIFYMYETRLPNNSTFNSGYNNYYAEQLMPKPCSAADANWPICKNRDDEDLRKQLIKTIGNAFIMDETGLSAMKKVHNSDFSTKKATLITWTANIRSSAQILSSMTTWDSKAIKDRNNGLAKAFVEKIWPCF